MRSSFMMLMRPNLQHWERSARCLPVNDSHLEEMARNFNIFSMLGMCFCIIATVDLSACPSDVKWEALSSVMAPGLTSGGSVAILYGYVAAAIGAGFVAASLSEIGSIWPTSGG